MQHVRANTEAIVIIGPFVDITDGLTPETGVALGTADEAEILKHATATVTDISGATWAAVASCDGYYALTLTAALTDTEGRLTVVVQDDSVSLPVRNDFMVLSEAAYDSLYVAKDDGYMDVNVKAISEDTTAPDTLELFIEALDQATGQLDAGTLHDDTITAASINTGAITADAFAADAIAAATLATGAITADAFAADAIVAATLATGAITADAFAADAIVAATLATGAITADAFAANAIVEATLAADCITAAKIADDAIGDEHWNVSAVAGCAVTSIANNAITAAAIATDAIDADALAADAIAEINATVDSALADINLDHLMLTGDATLTNIVADNTALAHLMAIGADISDYDSSTDSLEGIAGAGGGGAPTVEQIRTEMDSNSTKLADIVADTNELQADWANGGRLDLLLDATLADTAELQGDWTNGGRLDLIVDAILADTNELQSDDYPTTLAAVVADTEDIQSRLPAALVSGRMSSDAVAISGSTTAADNVEANIGNLDAAISTTDTVVDNIYSIVNGDHGCVSIQDDIDTVLTRLVGTIAAGTHNAQSGDAYSYLGTNLGALGANATEAGGTGDHLTALATAANQTTIIGYIDTEIAAILAAVDTEVAAIKAKTDNLPTDPADQSAVEAAITAATSGLATAAALATVDGIVDDILVDTGTTLDALLKRVAVVCIGDVTQAGTAEEIFVYGSPAVTATVTVDEDGNRSIAWS